MSLDRRTAIVKAAERSFSTFGYKATTIEQVAKLANVGKGTIYTFFKNKEELFDTIVDCVIKEMEVAANKAVVSGAPVYENVHSVMCSVLEFRREHQLIIKLMQEHEDVGTPAVEAVIQKLDSTVLSVISEKLKLAIERGDVIPCDPEITSFVMVKLYVSLIFDWEKEHEPLSKERIAEIFQIYLVKGLLQ